jgi:hypothetical protein
MSVLEDEDAAPPGCRGDIEEFLRLLFRVKGDMADLFLRHDCTVDEGVLACADMICDALSILCTDHKSELRDRIDRVIDGDSSLPPPPLQTH